MGQEEASKQLSAKQREKMYCISSNFPKLWNHDQVKFNNTCSYWLETPFRIISLFFAVQSKGIETLFSNDKINSPDNSLTGAFHTWFLHRYRICPRCFCTWATNKQVGFFLREKCVVTFILWNIQLIQILSSIWITFTLLLMLTVFPLTHRIPLPKPN